MKKSSYLTIIALAVTCYTAVLAQNVVYETIYLNPKTESLKELGEKMMTYVMALLILPILMDNMTKSVDYTNFLASRKKTIN